MDARTKRRWSRLWDRLLPHLATLDPTVAAYGAAHLLESPPSDFTESTERRIVGLVLHGPSQTAGVGR